MHAVNLLLNTDSYKFSHHRQYPPDAEIVYSYLESRGGRFDNIVVAGAQALIAQHLAGKVVTQKFIREAERFTKAHMGDHFNTRGWEYILHAHGGRLPLLIKAAPEGTVVSPHQAIMTVENTDPKVPWLTNYVETLLMQVWYPITIASQSRAMAQTILASLERSGTPSLLPVKLHDFGFRGVTCVEQAGIGGAAHLITFEGTDTVAAIDYIERFYNTVPFHELCPERERFSDGFTMPGFSIPASEHSTITSWGRDHELSACRNMLERYPAGLVACVSDSYDIFNACEHIWGGALRDQILLRDGCLVVRPDSGDPHEVLPRVLTILADKFGSSVNPKGYRVINPKVRVIQGDGITRDTLGAILESVERAFFSADNISFGSGGGLLQSVNRDTCRFAFKCSAIRRAGDWHPVYKDPITDQGKRSMRGRLKLTRLPGGSFLTLSSHSHPHLFGGAQDELWPIFKDGYVLNHSPFAAVRARARAGLKAAA